MVSSLTEAAKAPTPQARRSPYRALDGIETDLANPATAEITPGHTWPSETGAHTPASAEITRLNPYGFDLLRDKPRKRGDNPETVRQEGSHKP